MGEHMFCAGVGRVPSALAKQIESVARKHGADFVWAKLPEGYRYWFTAPNRGFPHDVEVERAVMGALRTQGLWGDDGPALE